MIKGLNEKQNLTIRAEAPGKEDAVKVDSLT
jgi:hypothetical protein